jgi:hypothetical protein
MELIENVKVKLSVCALAYEWEFGNKHEECKKRERDQASHDTIRSDQIFTISVNGHSLDRRF